MAQSPSYQFRGLARTVALPEASTQTFKIGDFLTLDSNGRVQQALSAGTNAGASSAGTTTNRIVGRAMQNATGTTGKLVSVILAEPQTEFLVPVYHGTPSSAVPNTNLIGKGFELRYASGTPNFFAVDISASTNPKVKITDIYPPDHTGYDPSVPGYPTAASTTQYGQVWVTFIDEQTALTGATLV